MPAPESAEHRPAPAVDDRHLGDDKLAKKKVGEKAFGRLGQAQQAIEATKKVLNYGAGNQHEAMQISKMNSYFRQQVMRDAECWELAPEVKDIAEANFEATLAAKADLAHGGNCGEHAWIAYHHLRANAGGQHIQVTVKSGLDHMFVLVGDLKDADNELAVADAWTTRPTACLWEDHFAYEADRSKVEDWGSMVADGKNVKNTIAAGLRLSAKGKKYIAKALTQKQADKAIDREELGAEGGDFSGELHVWNNVDSASTKYNYTP